MILEAQIQAEEQIDFTLRKAQFFDRLTAQLNEHQLRVLRRMLEDSLPRRSIMAFLTET